MRNKILIGLIIFAAFGYGILVGCKKVFPYYQFENMKAIIDTKSITSIIPDEIVIYKRTQLRELKLNIFYPPKYNKKNKYPAAVFFSGGGWIEENTNTVFSHCKALSDKGMICAVADYRTAHIDGTSPQHSVEDAKSSIRYLRENANRYGLDINKIVAGGISAGGHIAAATGTLSKYDNNNENLKISSIPNAMILIAPVFDNSQNGYGFERVKYYWKDISPLHNISEKTPPTIILVGSNDAHISVKSTEEFKKSMDKYGIKCDLFIYEDYKHKDFGISFYDEFINKADDFLVDIDFLL